MFIFACMNTDKSVFVAFRKASALSDIACPDGEFLDADDLLPDDSSGSGTATGSNKNMKKESIRIPARGESLADIPAGFHLIGSHRISADCIHVIAADNVGNIQYLQLSAPADGWRQIAVATADMPDASADGKAAFSHVATVGPWLVLLPSGGGKPLYALCNKSDQTYSEAATMPQILQPQFSTAPAALSGFCSVAGDFPTRHLRIECPQDIQTAVGAWLGGTAPAETSYYSNSFVELRMQIAESIREAWTDFIANADAAGLIVLPRYASVALHNPSEEPRRQVLGPTAPQLITGPLNAEAPGHADNVHVRIADFSFSSATLLLTVEFSCRPMRLSISLGNDIRPDFLKILPEGETHPKLLLSDAIDVVDLSREISSLRSLPASSDTETRGRGWILYSRPASECRKLLELPKPTPMLWGDNLSWNATTACNVHADGELLNVNTDLWKSPASRGGMAFNGRLVLFGEGKLQTFAPDLPFLSASIEEFEGGEILALRASYRSLSSGELGDFPIYAFCSDGIRALSPEGDGFRSVQLICRDVPLAGILPVATTSGVVFLSSRGVMMLEGSKAVSVAGLFDFIEEIYPDGPAPAVIGLAWHYASDSVILIFADGRNVAYSVAGKRWTSLGIFASDFVEVWPELYVAVDGKLTAIESDIWRDSEENASRGGDRSGDFSRPQENVPVRTLTSRPFKLGRWLGFKKILSAELAPDGTLVAPWRLEASNDLHHWYPLAKSPMRRLPRLRGSAWRFFRIILPVTTAIPSGIHVAYRDRPG